MPLNKIQSEYTKLLKQLSKIGFIIMGSINTVFSKCGKKNCICNIDCTKKHGPYFILTRKVKGKTVSKRLKENQIQTCTTYIKNKKKLDQIIEQMIELSIDSIADNK